MIYLQVDFSVPAPLKMQAYQILKKAIISGVLKDHDSITEKIVHEKFKISRTPFREAIQVLESEGWVYTIPYKGTFVQPITLKDIQELFELRQLMEPNIIDYLIENSREDYAAKQLEEMVNKMRVDESLQDVFEFMSLDQEFHSHLYQLTENSRIKSVSDQISDMMLRVGIRLLDRKSRRDEVIEEHRRIISGLKDATAKDQLRAHLNKTKESFIKMYEESGGSGLERK